MSNKQIAARLGQIILVLLGISFITFALVMLAPGDVVRQMIAGGSDLQITQAEIDAVRKQLGLDKPFFFQYLDWLGRAVTGDLGTSFMAKKPVWEALCERLPGTLMLSIVSLIGMMIIAVPAGIYSAVNRGGAIDYIVRGFTFIGVSLPGFWVGLMLLWILGLHLDLIPIVGGEADFENVIGPALTLIIPMASKYTRQVRTAVLEELHQDYVVGARARGMSETHILWREVLPNALLPLITLLGLSLGSLLGGVAVIEMVFSWPGLGRLAIEAITYRDFQLVQGVVIWIALMYMVINLVVDLSYNYLDPRLRKAR
ncbi:MAG: ABC transporter permease [Phascolarctobacterium sp.]|nr:ABC transporter permease [Phascolarctobacterium sp.]